MVSERAVRARAETSGSALADVESGDMEYKHLQGRKREAQEHCTRDWKGSQGEAEKYTSHDRRAQQVLRSAQDDKFIESIDWMSKLPPGPRQVVRHGQ